MAASQLHDEVLFNALKAVWTADSTNHLSGGSPQDLVGIRAFMREGDPLDRPPVPYIVCSVESRNIDSMSAKYVDGRATLVIYSEQNLAQASQTNQAEQNAFAAEILRLYDDADLSTTGTDWKFSRSFVGTMRQLPSVDSYNRYAIPINVTGYKVDTNVVAQLVGAEGYVTWTPGGSGAPIYTLGCEVVGNRISADESVDVAPPGAKWAEPSILSYAGNLILRVKVGRGTTGGPRMPDGIIANVTVAKDKADTGNGSWTFNALVFRMDHTSSLSGEAAYGSPQTVLYECRSVGTITEKA